jgi:hypothetical protein
MKVWIGVAAVAVAVVGIVTDIFWKTPRNWFDNHQFTASIIVELLLLAATLALIERVLDAREARKWERAARGPLTITSRWLVATRATYARYIHSSLQGSASDARQARDALDENLRLLKRSLEVFEPLALAHSSLIERWTVAGEYRAYVAADISGPDQSERLTDWHNELWDAAVAAYGPSLRTEMEVRMRQLNNYGTLIDLPEVDEDL